jgi:hypothetical protein
MTYFDTVYVLSVSRSPYLGGRLGLFAPSSFSRYDGDEEVIHN